MENTAIQDARMVAEHLGVEFHVIDLEEKFVDKVVKNFIGDYFNGETPNPCVYCNKYIKFDLMYKVAEELNCSYVATGHYATIEFNEDRNLYELKKEIPKVEKVKKEEIGRASCRERVSSPV